MLGTEGPPVAEGGRERKASVGEIIRPEACRGLLSLCKTACFSGIFESLS